jgi:orotate phosphoribosyltransferase
VLNTVRSLTDLNATIVRHLHRIPRDVDAVIGIPRSGLLASVPIATHLQTPHGTVEGFCENKVIRRSMRVIGATRILLVDDTVNKGSAMRQAVDLIKAHRPDARVIRLAVWSAAHTPPGSVDLALEECPCPRAFAWNMWRHKRLPRWCSDFDGVLCRDPNSKENDDGPRYEHFIRTAEPRFLPERPLGWIVTARLEKYRALSEEWLTRHGVRHAGLIMMDLPDKAARMAQGNRAGWKAETYRSLTWTDGEGTQRPAELFIESDSGQARKIAALTGKPVWCTDTQTFFAGEDRLVVGASS